MKHLFSLLFISLSYVLFSQENPIISHDNLVSAHDFKTKTLKINMEGYTILNFEALKSELIAWKEKVNSIDINQNTKTFTLIHNLNMDNRELFDVLNKYNIQKNSIISYQ